jgi:hydrogenase maturation protease
MSDDHSFIMYFSMVNSTKTLIIGIGNTLMGDDGAGPQVISILSKNQELNADLLCLDTPGFSLLTYIIERQKVIVVDAAQIDAPPGTVLRITRDQILEKKSSGLSLHDSDPFSVYDQAKNLGLAPQELVVYAIRFETITPRQGLSPSVEAGAERAADLIAQEVGGNA